MVLLLICFSVLLSPGKSHSECPESGRNVAIASSAWVESGTMCGVPIFIRFAGMFQRAASRSNSDHFAAINSPVRTKVRAISLIANRVMCVPG